jgi:hypothetical protein
MSIHPPPSVHTGKGRGEGRGGLFVWLGRNGSAKINIENNKIVKVTPPPTLDKGKEVCNKYRITTFLSSLLWFV